VTGVSTSLRADSTLDQVTVLFGNGDGTLDMLGLYPNQNALRAGVGTSTTMAGHLAVVKRASGSVTVLLNWWRSVPGRSGCRIHPGRNDPTRWRLGTSTRMATSTGRCQLRSLKRDVLLGDGQVVSQPGGVAVGARPAALVTGDFDGTAALDLPAPNPLQ